MNGRQISVSYGEAPEAQNEFWRDETIYRMTAGFYLDTTDLTTGMIVDKGCPLAINFGTKQAKPCKAIRIAEAAASNAVNIKVAKGSLVKVGDFVTDGEHIATVETIDKTDKTVDKIKLAATLGVGLAIGAVLYESTAADNAEPKNKANYLNYRRTHVDVSVKQTITAVGQAYEIFGSRLPNPCSEKDKENLGARYMFID